MLGFLGQVLVGNLTCLLVLLFSNKAFGLEDAFEQLVLIFLFGICEVLLSVAVLAVARVLWRRRVNRVSGDQLVGHAH